MAMSVMEPEITMGTYRSPWSCGSDEERSKMIDTVLARFSEGVVKPDPLQSPETAPSSLLAVHGPERCCIEVVGYLFFPIFWVLALFSDLGVWVVCSSPTCLLYCFNKSDSV